MDPGAHLLFSVFFFFSDVMVAGLPAQKVHQKPNGSKGEKQQQFWSKKNTTEPISGFCFVLKKQTQ